VPTGGTGSFDDEPWRQQPPFTCQGGGTCEGRIAACASERFVTRVSPGECTDTGGQRCESDGVFHLCPEGTRCADVPGDTALTAACVDPSALGADAGAVPWLFVGACGNGHLDNIESCDDGNQTSGDGCSRFCTFEAGWSCNVLGEACVPQYGDEICPANACRLGALCLDTGRDTGSPLTQAGQGISCVCPAAQLRECTQPVAIALPLPIGASGCTGRGISGDGTTVVGSCTFALDPEQGSQTLKAAKWTIARGLETQSEGRLAIGNAVSEDGSIVVGGDEAGPFIWSSTGMQHLDADLTSATSLSADGRVIVGGDTPGWVWTAAAGLLRLPPAREGRRTAATHVSADGRVVVGYEWDEQYLGQALTWTLDGQVQALRLLPEELGPVDASAEREDWVVTAGLNADGTLMVANYASPNPADRSVILRTPEGSRILDVQPPSTARALSADGTTLIGRSGPNEDALWDLAGDEALQLVLPRPIGSTPPQVTLTNVSSDGRVMSGTGIPAHPRDARWRAFLIVRR
jgi:cysteine-rich repeat protein